MEKHIKNISCIARDLFNSLLDPLIRDLNSVELKLFKKCRLSTVMTEAGPILNLSTEIEALTVLQAEAQNIVVGISRLDMVNDQKEQKLNLDFKILSWDEQIFIGWRPTYLDFKSTLDPEVMKVRGEAPQSL